MGGGLLQACSLFQGLLPPPPQRPLHSTLTLAPSSPPSSSSSPTSPVFVLFVAAVVVVMLGAPPVTDARDLQIGGRLDPSRQLCDIRQCWDLYEDTQSYLNVHITYEPQQLHLDPEKRDDLCLAKRTFYVCLKAMFRNKSLDCHSNIGFRGAFNGIERSMEGINCSREGPVFDPSKLPPDLGPGLVCTYNGPSTMRFCSLFGDPHLRTFMDEFQTCQVQGAWPLLDNRYLTVQVTSKAVGASSGPATAITELTVMIKAHDVCAAERFVTYQAWAGLLPGVFDDGSVDFGPEKSVTLVEVVPQHHVEIYLRYIDTTVVVRHYPNQVSPFLTVSLLMPEMILNQSASHLPHEDATVQTLELCSRGCPDNQQIDYMAYLAKTRTATVTEPKTDSGLLFPEEKNSVAGMKVMMTRQEALRKCQRLRLVDMYLDSCVFDLMNTGDTNFSQATADALADTIRLHPDGAGALENRTTLKELPVHPNSNYARTIHNNTDYLHGPAFVLLVAMVTCAFSTWWSQRTSVCTTPTSTSCSSRRGRGASL